MTTPATGTEDIPLAKVQKGFSELVAVLAALSTLLITVFGHDFGVAQSITQITAVGPIVLPIGIGLSRAIKHKGVAHANAIVLAAQIAQGVSQAGRHAAPAVPAQVGSDFPVQTL